MLRAVTKPCQCSMLLIISYPQAARWWYMTNVVISVTFTRYWTYTEIAARIIEGVRKSNTDEHLGRTGGRIVRRSEVEARRSPRLQ
jgi:hypothetical protein